MPAPRKVDLLPDELKARLTDALREAGFGRIEEITESLNWWLAEAGLELTIGKTAVGEFSKVLKQQRAAFDLSRVVLSDLDIAEESNLYLTLNHLIAGAALKLIQAVAQAEENFDTKELQALAKTAQQLASAAGLREKMQAEAEKRGEAKARRAAAEQLTAAAKTGAIKGLSAETVEAIKRQILGVAA